MILRIRVRNSSINERRDRVRLRGSWRRPITVIQSQGTESARDVEIHDDRERLCALSGACQIRYHEVHPRVKLRRRVRRDERRQSVRGHVLRPLEHGARIERTGLPKLAAVIIRRGEIRAHTLQLERRHMYTAGAGLRYAITVNSRSKRVGRRTDGTIAINANELKLGSNTGYTVLVVHIRVLLPLLVVEEKLEDGKRTLAVCGGITPRKDAYSRISAVGRDRDRLDHTNMEGLAGEVRAGQFSATLEHRHTGATSVPRKATVGPWPHSAIAASIPPSRVCHSKEWSGVGPKVGPWGQVHQVILGWTWTRGVGAPSYVGQRGSGVTGRVHAPTTPPVLRGRRPRPCPLRVVSGRRGHATSSRAWTRRSLRVAVIIPTSIHFNISRE